MGYVFNFIILLPEAHYPTHVYDEYPLSDGLRYHKYVDIIKTNCIPCSHYHILLN